jgi:hypothetical protein
VILSLFVSLSLAQGIRPPWPRPAEPSAPPPVAAPDDRTVRDYRSGTGWVDVRWDAKSRRWEPVGVARRDDATRDVGPPPDEAEATRRRAEWSALKQRAEAAEADATEQRRRAEQAEAGLDALVRSDAYEARGRRPAAPAAVPQRTSPVYVQPAPAVPTYIQPVAIAQPASVLQFPGPAYGTTCVNCGRSPGFRGFGGGFRSIPAAPP